MFCTPILFENNKDFRNFSPLNIQRWLVKTVVRILVIKKYTFSWILLHHTLSSHHKAWHNVKRTLSKITLRNDINEFIPYIYET